MNFYNLLLLLIVTNTFSFCLFGIDKKRAINGSRRISENALLASALALGGFGAMAGMKVFHHKTKKQKFKIAVPISIVLNIGIILYILYCFNRAI